MFRRQTLHLYRWKQECKNSQKRGEIADNGCIEWFHSVLKSETFYLHKWRNITEDSLTDIVRNSLRGTCLDTVSCGQVSLGALDESLPKCVENINRTLAFS